MEREEFVIDLPIDTLCETWSNVEQRQFSC